MVRGSGKYKVKRGGGRQFTDVRDMKLGKDRVAVSKRSRRDKKEGESEDEDESEEEEGEGEGEVEEVEDAEESAESEAGNSKGAIPSTAEDVAASRNAKKEEKRKAKAAAGDINDEDADLPVNANRLPVKNLTISDINAPRELNRKEREAKEKQEAKERYWKLHQQGKTDQAKADLARLAQIRKQREEAAAARKSADGTKAAEAGKS